MIFSTSFDPLKSMVTVRRKFISFHQNNEIVHFISFNSLQETITYAIFMVTTSFRLTSITDKRIKVGIKETNNNVNFDHGLAY